MPSPRRPIDVYTPEVGCLLMVLVLCGMCLLPIAALDVMQQALKKLHLTGPLAALTLVGILLGGLINFPLYKRARESEQPRQIGYSWTSAGWTPLWDQSPQQTVVAVNLGGCLIPVALAVWMVAFILADVPQAKWALLLACGVNIAACYFVARPIAGVGIAIPAFVSPAIAVGMAWLLLRPEEYDLVRAPVAFVAGVAGPLIGADLLHLRKFERLTAGVISIGGAGTFDGIVISSLLAAFLA